MPIYEYRCQSCDHTFEHLARSMNDAKRVACPECGSGKTDRMLSVFAAHQSAPTPSCGAMPGAPPCSQCPGAQVCGL